MKPLLSRFMALLAFAVLCSAFFSAPSAAAKPNITYHVTNVILETPGEATIEGYFTNDGSTSAYVKCLEFDLVLTADDGQQLWADYGIEHYIDVFVPAHKSVDYTFYLRNTALPLYDGDFTWNFRYSIQWDTAAG